MPIDKETSLEMYRLFRRLHQRNRFVAAQPVARLTLSESHFLKELCANPDHSQKSLAALLELDQSSMSRIMKNLEARRLLRVEPNPRDRRARILNVTSPGKRAVLQSDRVSSGIFRELASGMSNRDIQSLVSLFAGIADGYKHPQGICRTGEHRFLVEQRRITRCFRLLGASAFGSGLTAMQWQILSEIAESPFPLGNSVISSRLNIPATSVSLTIKIFERENLVQRTESHADKRASLVSATERGKARAKSIADRAAGELARALGRSSARQVAEWLSVLRRYVLGPEAAMMRFPIAVARTAQERSAARAFLIQDIARRGCAAHAPALMAGEENVTCLISAEGDLLAVFDFTRVRGKLALSAAGWRQVGELRIEDYVTKHLPAFLKTITTMAGFRISFAPLRRELRERRGQPTKSCPHYIIGSISAY